MNVIDVMDAIATHAVLAAAAVDPLFVDVAVGFEAARGRCIRIYYGGEVSPPAFADRDLNGKLVGERIVIDALWPIASSGKEDGRAIIGHVWTLKHELRTRLLGDPQLGGDTQDMAIQPATVAEILLGGRRGPGQHYLNLQMLVDLAYTEYPITP